MLRPYPVVYNEIHRVDNSWLQPYLDSDMGNRWFDFGGDTIIRADRYIRPWISW